MAAQVEIERPVRQTSLGLALVPLGLFLGALAIRLPYLMRVPGVHRRGRRSALVAGHRPGGGSR